MNWSGTSAHRRAKGRILAFAIRRCTALAVLSVFTAYLASSLPSAQAASPVILPAAPTLPTIGSTVYNVTVSNPAIDSGLTASTGSSNNAAVINAFISYVSTHGGGIVEIPGPASGTSTFKSNTLTMKSNVNLQIDNGAILQDATAGGTLITASNGSDMAITGAGTIDGNATTTATSSNLVTLQNLNRLLISGVTIENAGHEHLVPEKDTNVTISGITIKDPNNNNTLANTDGIDFSGSNFLIQNCSISDGDDDIVAKPGGFNCNNIVINNCTIGAGHGISIGGGSAKGLSNMVVANCTLSSTNLQNPIQNGLRMKASQDSQDSDDLGGGTALPITNVKFINITMNNVSNPVVIDSFYDNGNNNFPSSPSAVPASTNDATTPYWENIVFENVTSTNSGNNGRIFGLNDGPNNNLDGLAFSNVSISGGSAMDIWYGNHIDLSGLSTTLSTSNLSNLTTGGIKLLPGDFNRDGHVDMADVQAMLIALTDLPGYEALHGLNNDITNNGMNVQMEVIGDLNNDFQINNADLQALLTLLQGGIGSTSGVPEPTSLTLLAVGLASCLILRLARQRRQASPSH